MFRESNAKGKTFKVSWDYTRKQTILLKPFARDVEGSAGSQLR